MAIIMGRLICSTLREKLSAVSVRHAVFWPKASSAPSGPNPFELLSSFRPRLGSSQTLCQDLHSFFATGQPQPAIFGPSTFQAIKRRVQLDPATFRSAMETHDLRLRKSRGEFTQYTQIAIRIPKFVIFRRAGVFVMAICDSASSVDPRALQLSFEPPTTASLATPDELARIGFARDRVGPAFRDPDRWIGRIFIDASIFFQYLVSPRSRVMVPLYDDQHDGSSGETSICAISSFIRTLFQVHGEEKIKFANISVKRTKGIGDTLLTGLLLKRNVFTRFAPTPSNSLHIGSIRTALVSYLFYLSGNNRSAFHVRFDDTNVPDDVASMNSATILADLEWAGMTVPTAFRQTDTDAAANYARALSLLVDAGYCRAEPDGAVTLDVDAVNRGLSGGICWLDLLRGPQILHRLPVLSSNSHQLDYSMTWPNESAPRFKYKFAGAVDDFLRNSLVIRDERQDHSGFTIRQAAIMGCLRDSMTYLRHRRCKPDADSLREAAFDYGKSLPRPFPFLCPPVYLHVDRVSDEKGSTLSKRDLKLHHSIQHIRTMGVYFSETVFVWCLHSFGKHFLRSIGFDDLDRLIDIVSRVGVRSFLRELAPLVKSSEILRMTRRGTIRLEGFANIDYRVLQCLPPVRLRRFVQSLCEANGKECPPQLSEAVPKLYLNRSHFSGASDLSSLILTAYLGKSPFTIDVERPTFPDLPLHAGYVGDWIGSLPPEIRKWVRFCCTGRFDGPRLSIIHDIIGSHRLISLMEPMALTS